MYVDANEMPEAKKKAREMKKEFGLPVIKPKAVDLEFGFVPTNLSQSAKGGQSNVKETADMNLKRFDYKK